MKRISIREFVLAGALMALAVVLYLIDKQLTIPLNAIWQTGGATTLAYFLPVMILASFFNKRLFFIGITALVFAMFVIGTGAKSLFDYILEYVIPIISISSFFMLNPYHQVKSRFRIFMGLMLTLAITYTCYVIAGMYIYGVPLVGSLSYNGTLMIFPVIVLSFLVLPVFEVYAKLIN